jgi:hypothetical protein
MEIVMNTYNLYIANARRQKVAGFWIYKAKSFNEARRQFQLDHPTIDYLNLEVLAD